MQGAYEKNGKMCGLGLAGKNLTNLKSHICCFHLNIRDGLVKKRLNCIDQK